MFLDVGLWYCLVLRIYVDDKRLWCGSEYEIDRVLCNCGLVLMGGRRFIIIF